MIDSIGGSTISTASGRANALTQASSLRGSGVLTAVQQTQQKSSGAVAPVKVFAVPQASNTGASTTSSPSVPRGSLVDVLI